MFSLTFPKLYQNCAIFPIRANCKGLCPIPNGLKKNPALKIVKNALGI